MPQTLSLKNFSSANIVESTSLTANALAGATTLQLQNTNGLLIGDYLLLGTPGAEQSEIVTIATVPNGTSVTTSAAVFTHYANDTINKLFGNQIKVYRAANTTGVQPADTSFSLLGAALAIDPDQAASNFTDATGGADFWYKYTFYNSTTTLESALASATAVRGGNYGNYTSVDDIRTEAGFNKARSITDDMIDVKRQAAQAEVNGSLGGFYVVPFASPVNSFIADITTRLAAGLLLLEQYGAYDTSNTQNGKQKVDMARADLMKLQNGTLSLRDATGATTASSSASGGGTVNGWPNNSTTAKNLFSVETIY